MGMEGLDQKAVVSSIASNKSGKTVVNVVPKADQHVSHSIEQSGDHGSMASCADPTRFGDWEYSGRCIDF